MNPKAIVEKVDRESRLDPTVAATGNVLQSAVDKAGKPALNALNGSWLGHPLHPALTDLPVGAFAAASLLDLTPADKAADAAIAVGLIGAAPTALAGWSDWYVEKDQRVKRTGLVHAASNVAALLLYGASLGLRKTGRRGAGKALGWMGFGALFIGAYLGGHMVYNLGAGTDVKNSPS